MVSINEKFDPSNFVGVRRSLSEAETLPPLCYTSKEFFGYEIQNIFYKKWNFVCRSDELPKIGDYSSYILFGEPIFLVRGHDNKIRAFANTCSHRGARLVCDKGNRNRISCPYHSWTYSLDGSLLAAPDMGKTEFFEKTNFLLC